MQLTSALLLLAGCNALFHWIALAQGKETARRISKTPFCLILALYVALSLPSQWGFPAAALVLSALGDFFLIFDSHVFIPGVLSFIAAHFCYFVTFFRAATVRASPP